MRFSRAGTPSTGVGRQEEEALQHADGASVQRHRDLEGKVPIFMESVLCSDIQRQGFQMSGSCFASLSS